MDSISNECTHENIALKTGNIHEQNCFYLKLFDIYVIHIHYPFIIQLFQESICLDNLMTGRRSAVSLKIGKFRGRVNSIYPWSNHFYLC